MRRAYIILHCIQSYIVYVLPYNRIDSYCYAMTALPDSTICRIVHPCEVLTQH